MRPRVIQVDRSNRGFGLSLIYRGLDKYEEKDTGIFVARVVPGGQAARFGVKENDKIISINNRNPRNVDDAVGIIKVGILFLWLWNWLFASGLEPVLSHIEKSCIEYTVFCEYKM